MKAIWWLIGIIIAVLVIWWVAKGDSYNATATPTYSGTPEVTATSPVSTATATANTTVSGIGPSGTATNATYSALVTQYAGKRIQFDAGCQAIPKTAVFKTGTKVMFDNRSGDARTIVINGSSYRFPGYGYQVITLSSSTLPKTFMIDCGSAQNTGTITIEK